MKNKTLCGANLNSLGRFALGFQFGLLFFMGVLRVVPSNMCYVACHRFHRTVRPEGIDFIISSSIRNYFGSNLCRPFALGLWISYRGRPSRIMARRPETLKTDRVMNAASGIGSTGTYQRAYENRNTGSSSDRFEMHAAGAGNI